MEINTQEKITRAMKKAKVSQTKLADRFGVTQGTFSQRMKTGKFTQEEMKIIADELGAKYFSGFEFPDGEKIYWKKSILLRKPIGNTFNVWYDKYS